MITIKRTPAYITRELCERAGLVPDSNRICYAAVQQMQILGFCFITLADKLVTVIAAQADSREILDGVVRAAIAGGEELGAEQYAFCVDEPTARQLLPLGFVSGKAPLEIKKLFSACCTGCGKGKES